MRIDKETERVKGDREREREIEEGRKEGNEELLERIRKLEKEK